MRQDEEFTPLQIVKKNLLDSSRCMYRVYKSPAEYVTVEAATALEALRESGIKAPYKIKRQIRFQDRLMGMEKLSEAEDVIETVVMEPPLGIAAHREAVPSTEDQPKEVVKEAHELRQAEPPLPEPDDLHAAEKATEKTAEKTAPQMPDATEMMKPTETQEPPEAQAAADAAQEESDESELSEEEIAKLLDS